MRPPRSALRVAVLVAALGFSPPVIGPAPADTSSWNLRSASHVPGAWSADRSIEVAWDDPSADDTSVGYSFAWTANADTVPDEVADASTLTTVSPDLADGAAHRFHVRAQAADGTWSAPEHLGPFAIDATAPHSARISAPLQNVQTANRFAVRWWVGDAVSGIASYDARYRVRSGSTFTAYTMYRRATSSTSGVFSGRLRTTYCFSARARDRAGNVGAWSGERCTTIPAEADVPHATCGRVGARVVRFRVLVERGLDTTPAAFARDLTAVLCDSRSWIKAETVRFRYDPQGPLLISVRTPASTERRCWQLTNSSVRYYFSCAGSREAVLNGDRWFGGSDYLSYSVRQYRRLLVNHEVGHTLGEHHRGCPRDGAPAPAMMQQSKGLKGCTGNQWPVSYELRSLQR